MFIELTNKYGGQILINLKRVLFIQETNNGTIFQFENGDEHVNESYSFVAKIIKHEIQAERGL